MKSLFSLSLFFICSTVFGQNGIYWSPPVEVDGSAEGRRPTIALLSDNTPVLIWSKVLTNGDKDYYFSKWDNPGFTTPFQLNDAPVLTYDWGGTEIATDGDNIYTVFKEGNVTVGRAYIRKSSDGGLTWGSKVMIEDSLGELAMYPGVDAYDGNNVLVTYMTHGPGGINPQYVVRRSTDGGATFSASTTVSADFGDEACYCCPPAIVGNTNYQVMSFRNDANNVRDMKAGVSTNGGVTFDTQISLDDHNWTLASCPATGGDVVLNDAQLYSTYMSKGAGDEMIYFVEDDLSDAIAYTVSEAMSGDTATNMNYPHLSNQGDSVVLVWEQSLGAETDIWYNFSFDGMNDWNAASAQAVFQFSGIQNKPDVIVGTDGSIHLVYVDLVEDKVMYSRGTFSMAGLSANQMNDFSVYPNPAKGTIILDGISQDMRYQVLDMTGRIVLIGTGNSAEVGTLNSGTYYVKIQGYTPHKFVVK